MSIKIEETKNKNELKLEFNIEAKIFEDGIQKVFKKNAQYFNIPGFRKGKAPLNIVEKTYGKAIFYEDAFNEVVPEIFEKELKENNIEAVSKPEIDIIQMEKGKDLKFTAVVQTKPEVKVGKYKGIELKKIEYNVTEKDVTEELKKMADRNSRLVTVKTKRMVKKGDTAVIDFVGSVDGVEFEGGKAENHELEIGSGAFIPGFEDQVIGMKVEEEKDINVKFPDEYFSKDLAGKDAVFKVKLHEIKAKETPKIDDEFAKDVSEFDTLEELKADIKKKKEEENQNKAKAETEEAAVNAVCDNTKIDIPSGMIDAECDAMVEDMKRRIEYQGMKMEQYLKFINKTVDDLKAENRENAEKAVKTRLVLEAVFVDAKLEVAEADIDKKLQELADAYGRKLEELKANEYLKSNVEETLKTEKAINYIVENAKIK